MRRSLRSRVSEGLPVLALLGLLLPEARGDCSQPERIEYAELRSGEMKDNYLVGTILTYRCIPGYEFIPETTPQITCSNASEWVPGNPKFCQGRQCRPPDIENGRVVSFTDMRLGDRITFACDDGYRLIGDKTARCTLSSGKVDWDNRPYCQRIPCFPPPPIAHGGISGDVKDEYSYGSAIIYRCNADYSLIGKKTLVCRVAADGINGEWDSPPPECKVVQCPRPEIEHGSISAFLPSYSYDHSLVISCDAGYTLSGASLIKCGADNNWQPPIPTCVFVPVTTGTSTVTAPTPVPSGDRTAPGTTKSPEHKPVSTKAPEKEPASTKPPKDETGKVVVGGNGGRGKIGSNHALGLGVALGCIVLIAVVVASVWYYKAHHKKGKMDAGTGPPGSYGVVPQNSDMVLEEKEPSQV